MPIYEYRCAKCGEFEVTQKITDKALGKCPTCKGKVTKLISSTSFQLKGSGWYITDYARSGGASVKESSKSESTSSDTRTETKGEAKAESKSESKSETKPKASGSDKKGKQAAAA